MPLLSGKLFQDQTLFGFLVLHSGVAHVFPYLQYLISVFVLELVFVSHEKVCALLPLNRVLLFIIHLISQLNILLNLFFTIPSVVFGRLLLPVHLLVVLFRLGLLLPVLVQPLVVQLPERVPVQIFYFAFQPLYGVLFSSSPPLTFILVKQKRFLFMIDGLLLHLFRFILFDFLQFSLSVQFPKVAVFIVVFGFGSIDTNFFRVDGPLIRDLLVSRSPIPVLLLFLQIDVLSYLLAHILVPPLLEIFGQRLNLLQFAHLFGVLFFQLHDHPVALLPDQISLLLLFHLCSLLVLPKIFFDARHFFLLQLQVLYSLANGFEPRLKLALLVDPDLLALELFLPRRQLTVPPVPAHSLVDQLIDGLPVSVGPAL